mmetsp:Transcript_75804/g.158016  ORF Transcript_75804/g.158016 Transcript_75804/m.158016 type:complete len:475 (-) Transcript_75804:163-1587(-)
MLRWRWLCERSHQQLPPPDLLPAPAGDSECARHELLKDAAELCFHAGGAALLAQLLSETSTDEEVFGIADALLLDHRCLTSEEQQRLRRGPSVAPSSANSPKSQTGNKGGSSSSKQRSSSSNNSNSKNNINSVGTGVKHVASDGTDIATNDGPLLGRRSVEFPERPELLMSSESSENSEEGLVHIRRFSTQASSCCSTSSRRRSTMDSMSAKGHTGTFDGQDVPVEIYASGQGPVSAVRRAVRSPVGGKVLQLLIRRLGDAELQPLVQEICFEGPSLALDPSATESLHELISERPHVPCVQGLMDVIMTWDTASLCYHKFGHQVALYIFQHGPEEHRRRILEALEKEAPRACRHRVAAGAVATVLVHSRREEALKLAQAIMTTAGALKTLACHCFGVRVVREILQLPGVSQQALAYIARARVRLSRDKFGMELLRELEVQGALPPTPSSSSPAPSVEVVPGAMTKRAALVDGKL